MPLLTFIARVTDGMLLVASMEHMSDNQDTLDVYKSQAKQIFRKLNPRMAAKCSIESGPYTFHYVIEAGVCFLTLTDKGYPKRLAFLYLEEISSAFLDELKRDHGAEWAAKVDTVARPYAFIKFDKTIQKKRKEYTNPASRSNAHRLNDDLADIHNIMKKNINEVLNRGERLDHLMQTTSNLKSEATRYKWGAKKLSLMALYQQYGPFVAIGLFVALVLYLKFFWK